ncbi:metalloregulator ArsR/SmtB family transcription factor [Promicromonospora sukumoe]|jgi:DNA-binding transcriptional ArsR family regulator|uniref:DNA-binding transcriptional ArsR family regulator n=1 Tax=Promicromonospora sukumoe TaxID=88382 RepID=A0A7W3PE33_9MICO|nr:metalloregulator ArsR/SmtB family transcription factor [Promicromonospora sukumoe]MBA8808316.1 DNA-binding transcriptional ArsR family regulator [Promicromonospora sukumoe]
MDVFGAIADPIRRELLLRLADGPARVVDLAAEHAVSRPAISKHLRVLSEAGLVRGTDEGRERRYALDPAPLAEVRELLGALTARRAPVSVANLDALDTEVRRAARDRRRGTSASGTTANAKEQSA